MWGRRIGYGVSVAGCILAYLYFNQWAIWVLLWWLLTLPIFSLLLSIPAWKTARFSIDCPSQLGMDEQAAVQLQARCRFPLPAYKCTLQIRHCMTGELFTCVPGESLQTDHCGGQELSVQTLRLYDYFGLFFRKIKTVEPCVLTVEPIPVELHQLPGKNASGGGSRPKRGGGFSEEHDLRYYVPGDDLRQIHWKLTAKTGNYVVKEPLEQLHAAQMLTVVLNGTPRELDRKLGQLLWLSRQLLDRGEGHWTAALTGHGLERFSVTDIDSQKAMLHKVLTAPAAEKNAKLPVLEDGTRVLVIGGDADG